MYVGVDTLGLSGLNNKHLLNFHQSKEKKNAIVE